MKCLILILILSSQLFFAQSWQQIVDFPGTARDDGASFKIGNKVYCGIGLEVGWTCPNDFYSFDLSTETWSASTSFPNTQQRQYACGFSLNGKGYIFGGVTCDNTFLNDLWEYDTLTTNWTQKASLPGTGRSGSVSFTIQDTIYILGGRTSALNAIPDLWAYEPVSDTWMQKPNIPISGTWRGVAFYYNNQGIVGLGKNAGDSLNTDFYVYSTNKNGWAILAGLNHLGRSYTGYTQIDSTGYLFGGVDSLGYIDSTFEKFDLINFTMYGLTNFSSTPRKGCMSFAHNNSFYLTTGVSSTTRFNETWKLALDVGLQELKNENLISVFPNPSNGLFTIQSKTEEIRHVIIFDMLGHSIFELKNQKNLTLTIHEQIPKGIYVLECYTEKGKKIKRKLIIQ